MNYVANFVSKPTEDIGCAFVATWDLSSAAEAVNVEGYDTLFIDAVHV